MSVVKKERKTAYIKAPPTTPTPSAPAAQANNGFSPDRPEALDTAYVAANAMVGFGAPLTVTVGIAGPPAFEAPLEAAVPLARIEKREEMEYIKLFSELRKRM